MQQTIQTREGKKKSAKSQKTDKLKIPTQFKPERGVFDSAFHVWVRQTLDICPEITEDMLKPTQSDLELISQLAYQKDDIGTDLARSILKDRSLVQELERGLKEGSETLNNPPQVLMEFLSHYENIPEWAYLSDLNKYIESMPDKKPPSLSPPIFLLDGLAMAAGFFVGANYPSVGQSLVATGSVKSGTMRMKQSMDFIDNVSDISGLAPHGEGLIACAKVRLAHGFARIMIEKKGDWDKDYYGEIISDFDNMIFLSGLLLAEDRNKNLDDRVLQALRIQLNAVQYLLGAPKELVSMEPLEAKRFFTMVLAHLDDSPHTARQVVEAFSNNEYFRPDDTWQGKLSREASFITANFLTRISWGNDMANDIGLKKNVYGVPLSKLAESINNPPRVASNIFKKVEPIVTKNPIAKRVHPLLKKSAIKIINNISSQLEKKSGSLKERRHNTYKGSQGVF